jgi:hypothetical protein
VCVWVLTAVVCSQRGARISGEGNITLASLSGGGEKRRDQAVPGRPTASPSLHSVAQVNFVVPSAPAVTPYVPCSGRVSWNLMVTLFTANSFDGAGICVQTQ